MADMIDDGSWESRVLRFIMESGDAGMTCDEVEKATGGVHQTVSARIHSLRGKNLIVASGRTRLSRNFKEQKVWVGRRVAASPQGPQGPQGPQVVVDATGGPKHDL